MIPFVDLTAQYSQIKPEIDAAVAPLESGQFADRAREAQASYERH
jgi:hypothetical protein